MRSHVFAETAAYGQLVYVARGDEHVSYVYPIWEDGLPRDGLVMPSAELTEVEAGLCVYQRGQQAPVCDAETRPGESWCPEHGGLALPEMEGLC